MNLNTSPHIGFANIHTVPAEIMKSRANVPQLFERESYIQDK